jgi:osmotically-inducible protein OsmY
MPDSPKSADVDDRAIRGQLIRELEGQRWAHLLNTDIVVHHGVVEISGVIESEEERHALRLAAENVPGVRRVEDHCRLRPLFRLT